MSDSEQRKHLRAMFDKVANVYSEARPGYPVGLFELLVERCGLGNKSRVLEIGAGAGQATLPMLETGACVTAIEPGRALVHQLLERVDSPKLCVISATFEDADVEEAVFDIVVAATSFHWVDPAVRFAKSAYALRNDGWLAIWANHYADPDRSDPFHEAIQPLIEQYAPELISSGPSVLLQRPDTSNLAQHCGYEEFEEPMEHVFRWEGRHTPPQIRALFATFSKWIALPPIRRERILNAIEQLAYDEFDGVVIRPYRTIMHLRQRKSRLG